MKGLEVEMECPSCGQILKKGFPADSLLQLKRNLIQGDTKCGCGRTGEFTVLNYSTIIFEVKRDEN